VYDNYDADWFHCKGAKAADMCSVYLDKYDEVATATVPYALSRERSLETMVKRTLELLEQKGCS
jgi:hypothetical protein